MNLMRICLVRRVWHSYTMRNNERNEENLSEDSETDSDFKGERKDNNSTYSQRQSTRHRGPVKNEKGPGQKGKQRRREV